MKISTPIIMTVAMACIATAADPPNLKTVVEDDFQKGLGAGWTFVRENKSEWKIENGALQLRSQPGNIWATANKKVRNILLRKAPKGALVADVTVDFKPEKNAEQAGIFLYVDDDNYIKIGRERFNTQDVALVAERKAKPKVIKHIAFPEGPVRLRLTNIGGMVTAFCRKPNAKEWTQLAEIPWLEAESYQVGLYTFMGDARAERWAAFSDFRIGNAK